MSDIVERLRDGIIGSHRSVRDDHAIMREAADEIERLRKALEKIAGGDGYYGIQAREYKQIAGDALGRKKKT